MHIRIDLSQVPPAVQVEDDENFSAFSVVVAVPTHSWVSPHDLAALTGRQEDDEWLRQLTTMVGYADSQGWVDPQGRVRAHVAIDSSPHQTSEVPHAEGDR